MLTKDLSITFCGVNFPNPFCLSIFAGRQLL
ncbi:dihydropyrimidine dehydrogenase [Shigella flexneri]|uniref:Dihydropyrimidine dehydrogenase n=1 Tax=Shigella flexneri TaxID=623 RepID=A0A380AC27_SHIFL|nr:dihydropyrimidine dehydrogenase [Shigella flexneri]SUI77999.1 dihydropyrimidine dehydrogenase [Shigella flexneri]